MYAIVAWSAILCSHMSVDGINGIVTTVYGDHQTKSIEVVIFNDRKQLGPAGTNERAAGKRYAPRTRRQVCFSNSKVEWPGSGRLYISHCRCTDVLPSNIFLFLGFSRDCDFLAGYKFNIVM